MIRARWGQARIVACDGCRKSKTAQDSKTGSSRSPRPKIRNNWTCPRLARPHHSRYYGACLRRAIIKTRKHERISRHLAACLRGAMIRAWAAAKGSSSYPDKPGSDGMFVKRMLVMIRARWGQARIVACDGCRKSRTAEDSQKLDSIRDKPSSHSKTGPSPFSPEPHHSRYYGACLRGAIIKTRKHERISRHLAACLRGAMIRAWAAAKGSSSYPDKPGSDGMFVKRMLVMIRARWGQARIVACDGCRKSRTAQDSRKLDLSQ